MVHVEHFQSAAETSAAKTENGVQFAFDRRLCPAAAWSLEEMDLNAMHGVLLARLYGEPLVQAHLLPDTN